MPPMKGGPHCRLSSPEGGGSTLMTRAPMSARSMVQTGPERIRERSTTKRSSNGFMSLSILHKNWPRQPINFLDPVQGVSENYFKKGNKKFPCGSMVRYNTRTIRHLKLG